MKNELRQVVSQFFILNSVLVPAGRLERPTFRMSRGRSAVELRREVAPGQGFKPRFAASETAVLSLDDPGTS